MRSTLTITAFIASLIISGCATQATNTYQSFQTQNITDQFKQKVNNFLVIVDSSSSMSDTYQGSDLSSATKLEAEKNILHRMNQTLPGLKLTSGIRSYGYGPCTDWNYTKLNAPMGPYSKSSFESALGTLTCSSGGTPMYRAFDAASSDLEGSTGNTAVIVLSDGNIDTFPTAEVQKLKDQFGDSLCIYSIWVGNEDEQEGHDLMRKLSDAGGCGFVTSAGKIASSAGMANFVERVFLEPVDLPKDSDGDGVYDDKDQCPNTPKGAHVNSVGCWAYEGVFFDFDKATIKDKFHPLLTNAITVLKNNPGLRVEIQGHTDSRGSVEYNQKLSERRANAVKEYLITTGGINGSRLTAKGYGLTKPIASNETDEGRAKNRRVQYKRLDM